MVWDGLSASQWSNKYSIGLLRSYKPVHFIRSLDFLYCTNVRNLGRLVSFYSRPYKVRLLTCFTEWARTQVWGRTKLDTLIVPQRQRNLYILELCGTTRSFILGLAGQMVGFRPATCLLPVQVFILPLTIPSTCAVRLSFSPTDLCVYPPSVRPPCELSAGGLK